MQPHHIAFWAGCRDRNSIETLDIANRPSSPVFTHCCRASANALTEANGVAGCRIEHAIARRQHVYALVKQHGAVGAARNDAPVDTFDRAAKQRLTAKGIAVDGYGLRFDRGRCAARQRQA